MPTYGGARLVREAGTRGTPRGHRVGEVVLAPPALNLALYCGKDAYKHRAAAHTREQDTEISDSGSQGGTNRVW